MATRNEGHLGYVGGKKFSSLQNETSETLNFQTSRLTHASIGGYPNCSTFLQQNNTW